MFAMTAAHKTLPFGTLVRVTDKSTGNSVDVRINDRGVLPGDHVIDLSYEAAKNLGILRTGVVNVKLEVLAMGPSRHTNHQQ
jgi:rare lipoprotein A